MSENIIAVKESSNDVTSTHMNVTAQFRLLSIQLSGALEKNEKGIDFLIMPQQNNESEALSLDSAVDGINGFFETLTGNGDTKLDAQDIFEKIKEFISGVVKEDLKVSIKQVFVHFIKTKNGEVKLEYAFSIGVEIASSEKTLNDISLAQLESVTFGIWNTDNKKIIAQMGLMDISEQLE